MKERIRELAEQAGWDMGDEVDGFTTRLEKFAELVRADERKKVAEWMTERGYTTGHGDTTIKLVRYLEWQVAEKERESCLKLADGLIRAIRTRGKPPPSGLYLVSEPTEQSKRG
jgi:hypothetical protein